MAKLRAALFLVLVAGLVAMWTARDLVAGAYTDTGAEPLDIRLDGLDLDHRLTPMGVSPYTVATAPDTRNESVALAFSDTAPGAVEEAPAVELTGGTARLKGVVRGPDGPVAGATVRIERHTSAGAATVDLNAGGDGRWSQTHLLGGRYRVRAWHPDGFASAGSEVFFLTEHETHSLNLAVDPFDDEPALTFAEAGDIYVGLTGTVAVTVTVDAIDDAGLLAVVRVPGVAVSLEASSGVVVAPEQATTDAEGVARFQLRCLRAGSVTAMARHGQQEVLFVLPDCVPQPTTTTPPTTSGADGGSPTTTSTTTSGTTTISRGRRAPTTGSRRSDQRGRRGHG